MAGKKLGCLFSTILPGRISNRGDIIAGGRMFGVHGQVVQRFLVQYLSSDEEHEAEGMRNRYDLSRADAFIPERKLQVPTRPRSKISYVRQKYIEASPRNSWDTGEMLIT